MKYLIMLICLILVVRFLIARKERIKKVIGIVLIAGIVWCPLTLAYVAKHPMNSIKYGYRIESGLQRLKGDVLRLFPKDRYNLISLKKLPDVVMGLFN